MCVPRLSSLRKLFRCDAGRDDDVAPAVSLMKINAPAGWRGRPPSVVYVHEYNKLYGRLTVILVCPRDRRRRQSIIGAANTDGTDAIQRTEKTKTLRGKYYYCVVVVGKRAVITLLDNVPSDSLVRRRTQSIDHTHTRALRVVLLL